MPPSVFFPVFVRFIKAYRVSKHVRLHLPIRLSVCQVAPIRGQWVSKQFAAWRRIICTKCFVEISWQKRRMNRGGVRSRCYLKKWSKRSSRKKTPRWDSHLWLFTVHCCSFSPKKLRDTSESRWVALSFLITRVVRFTKPPDSRWFFLNYLMKMRSTDLIPTRNSSLICSSLSLHQTEENGNSKNWLLSSEGDKEKTTDTSMKGRMELSRTSSQVNVW